MSNLDQVQTTSTHRRILTLFGVDWTVDNQSWQFILPKLLIGLVVAFAFWRGEPIVNNILMGLLYSVLLNMVMVLHILGHIISSKFVAPAMTEARITPKLIETRYDNDIEPIAPQVHIIRSIGGPIMNLLLGVLCFVVWQVTGHHALAFLTGANWVFMVIVLVPIPTMDGGVIWREVYRMWR